MGRGRTLNQDTLWERAVTETTDAHHRAVRRLSKNQAVLATRDILFVMKHRLEELEAGAVDPEEDGP